MLRSFGLNQLSAAEIIAERENVLKLLAQTTKEKMGKGNYTIDPATRYPFLAKSNDITRILETQIDSDNIENKSQRLPKWSNAVENFEFDHKCSLLKFCQHAVSSFKIKISNFKSSSWSDGRALAGLVARFRKDLINYFEISRNNDSSFIFNHVLSVLEEEYGISKPSLSIFITDNNEDDLIRYIEKVVNHLRRDAGFEAHMISATLRAVKPESRKRFIPRVAQGETIKR
uniref:Calponin-homology (CH) domain-containing protein n=1 Tax=Panagrolaimus sp. ES5 TaxID=591445 RepID=A0AC34GIG2_9BILA